MPLLRQSLYAQNINLYLAPTADGRDAWLSLMRTVAVEGRCFVVSSNMCVRAPQDQPQTNGVDHGENSTESHGDGRDAVSQSAPRRRNSCLTEEGFEIALPSPASRRAASKRRQSIFDEDGNEIVLCGKGSAVDDAVSDTPVSPTVGGGTARAKAATKAPASTTTGNRFLSRGGSSIVSPFGDVLAGPQWEDDEGIIYSDVDFDDCIRGRLDLDAAGSYSRYGFFSLYVFVIWMGRIHCLECWLANFECSRNDSFKLSVQGLDLVPLPY